MKQKTPEEVLKILLPLVKLLPILEKTKKLYQAQIRMLDGFEKRIIGIEEVMELLNKRMNNTLETNKKISEYFSEYQRRKELLFDIKVAYPFCSKPIEPYNLLKTKCGLCCTECFEDFKKSKGKKKLSYEKPEI